MAHPNITDVNLSRGFGSELFYYVNDVTSSWISNMILIAIYIIVAMGVYTYKKDLLEGMSIAGYILIAVGTLFWLGNFISTITWVFVWVVGIVSFGALWFTKKSSN